MKKTIIASLLISSFLVCSYISFSMHYSINNKLDLVEDKEIDYGLIEEVKQLDIPDSPIEGKPIIGIQTTPVDENGKIAIRLIGAIKVTDMNSDGVVDIEDLHSTTAVWRRAVCTESGNSYRQYDNKESQYAYTAINSGGESLTIEQFNQQHGGTSYNYFVTYAIKNITQSTQQYYVLDAHLVVNDTVKSSAVTTSLNNYFAFSSDPDISNYFIAKQTSNGTEIIEMEEFTATGDSSNTFTWRAQTSFSKNDTFGVFRRSNKLEYITALHESSEFTNVTHGSNSPSRIVKVNSNVTDCKVFLRKVSSLSSKLYLTGTNKKPTKPNNYTIQYGLYPQTFVANTNNLYTNLKNAYNDTNAKQPNNWVKYNNEYYTFTTAHPYTTGYTFYATSTEIAEGTEYWFKCEPINWRRITESDTGEYWVISEKLLDVSNYSNNPSGTTDEGTPEYKDSDVRKYLNGLFYNRVFAFHNSAIQDSVTPIGNQNNNTLEYITDKLYLPNYPLMKYSNNYSGSDYFAGTTNPSSGQTGASAARANRKSNVTDWALANGAYKGNMNNGWYWLCDKVMNFDSTFASSANSDEVNTLWIVNDSGDVVYRPHLSDKPTHPTIGEGICIRPLMKIQYSFD